MFKCMFALRSHAIVRRRTHVRCFWAEFYQHLTPATNQFLDLAIALPFPPSFPPYASTILLGTVILRLAFLPTLLWVSLQETHRRYSIHVLPESSQGSQNGTSSEGRRQVASSLSASRVPGHAETRHSRAQAIPRRHTSRTRQYRRMFVRSSPLQLLTLHSDDSKIQPAH